MKDNILSTGGKAFHKFISNLTGKLPGQKLSSSVNLQSRCKDIGKRIEDKLRYCREPKSFWFYRLIIALRDSLSVRVKMSLSAWCRPP